VSADPRLVAAQKAADAIIAEVSTPDDGRPRLRIAVTDPVTNTRLATGFRAYDAPHLRLVEGER
jgi:hypothetical protein